MGAAAASLAALEIAVRGGGAALARRELVGIHAKAHGTPALTPLEPRFDEDPVQSFSFGLALDLARARHGERTQAWPDPAPLENRGRGPQVLDPRVGARAYEHRVHLDRAHRSAGLEAHVGERTGGGLPFGRCCQVVRARHLAVDGHYLGRVRAPGHVRPDLGCVQGHLGVEPGTVVGRQRPPRLDSPVPVGTFRRVAPSLQVLEGDLVRSDHPRTGTGLDGHVADRHAALHRQRGDRGASVLDDMTDPAGRAEPADDREHHVLGAHPEREIALDGDAHRVRPALGKGLGGEDMLDLRGSDAEGQRPEGTVGRGVAVSADDRHAGLGEALLGPDHVHDALALVSHGIAGHAELRAVGVERLELAARDRVIDAPARGRGGHVVVCGRDREIGSSHASAC